MATDFGFEPTKNESGYYFISYNTEDCERVGKIVKRLHSSGLPIWYDKGIEHNELWKTIIAEKISNCKEVILFFTNGIIEKSKSTKLTEIYTYKEYTMASKKYYDKKVLIVTLDDYNDRIPPGIADWMIELSEIQGIDARSSSSPEKIASMILKELNIFNSTDEKHAEQDNNKDKLVYVTEKAFSNGVYTGTLLNGIINGHGIFKYVNDDIFEGEYKDGKCNGHGIFKYVNDDIFEGEYKDGKCNGHGIYKFANGNIFEGEYKDGKRNGHGIYKFANGNIFEGEYKDDKYNGHGIYKFANGNIFEGEFKDNKRNGHGILKYADDDIFEGEYKDDKRDGHGILKFANGDIFEGEYKDDKRSGHGIFKFANDDIFEGEFKDGKRDGHGIYKFAKGIIFEGEFKDDKYNGHGILKYANGDIFEGEFKDNNAVLTSCKYTWNDGLSFSGNLSRFSLPVSVADKIQIFTNMVQSAIKSSKDADILDLINLLISKGLYNDAQSEENILLVNLLKEKFNKEKIEFIRSGNSRYFSFSRPDLEKCIVLLGGKI
ncbi:MAG: TIR domain-containing protein [Clostridia bacterium]|nr:TIR domain-containing protein [Clostridia bacterium]